MSVLFLLVAAFVVAPTFATPLGPVDDHEIPVLQQHLAELGPLETWRETDVGNGRFRPAYWLVRITETAVWGQNTTGWYLDRFALLLLTLAAGYLLARTWLSVTASALVALLVVAGPQAEAFYRLGPQEAWAVPLALGGFALIARRRFGGLALLCLAALTKEPFVLAAGVGVIWAWWLGSRRAAVLGGIVTLVIGLAILHAVVLNGGDYYSAQGLAVPSFASSPRYLYPFVIVPALIAGWLVSRHRWLAMPVLLLVVVGLGASWSAASWWADHTRTFAALVERLRVDPRPIVVTVSDPWQLENAVALRDYLPGRVTFGPPNPEAASVTFP